MRRPAVRFRRLTAATALLSVPTAAALAALVATGALAVGPALVAGLWVVAALGVLAWFGLSEVRAVRALLLAAVDRRAAPPMPGRSLFTRGLFATAERVRRKLAEYDRRADAQARALTTILDGVPEPVLAFDPAQEVTIANQAARALLGRDAVGRSLAAVLRDPDVLEAAQITLDGGEPPAVEFAFSAGMERTLLARFGRLSAPTPEGAVAIVTLQDLTAIKRTDELRADFVANAGHELRTPLATLLGVIETLRGPARDDAEARERFLALMNDQATRMSRVVEDLMSLSRIEMDEHTPPTEPVDMASIVEGVVDSLRLTAESRNMALVVELPGAPPRVPGDEHQLVQVVQNLVDNAIKYGRAGSEVRIAVTVERARDGEATVSLAVRDQGEGIEPEHLPRLTERFYRVDPARSRELGGTGLGLAIVKHIVNRHRGTLEIESVLGEGSTFTVRLPAAQTGSA